MLFVSAREREPFRNLRVGLEQFAQHTRLNQIGDGLDGEHIRPGRNYDLKSLPMKFRKLRSGYVIVAPILGPVVRDGAEWPNARGYPRT